MYEMKMHEIVFAFIVDCQCQCNEIANWSLAVWFNFTIFSINFVKICVCELCKRLHKDNLEVLQGFQPEIGKFHWNF